MGRLDVSTTRAALQQSNLGPLAPGATTANTSSINGELWSNYGQGADMSNPGAKSTPGAGVVFLEKRGVRHFIAARETGVQGWYS